MTRAERLYSEQRRDMASIEEFRPIVGGREPPPLPRAGSAPNLVSRSQTPPRQPVARETRPIVVAEGAAQGEAQVVVAQAVDPLAGGEEVPVVTVAPMERSQSTLWRTASATLVARPVIETRNNVPMVTCRCPKADDLPDWCEQCVAGLCGILAYFFYGAIVVFASWLATKAVVEMGVYDSSGGIAFVFTLVLVFVLGCVCAGGAKQLDADDAVGPCFAGFAALAVLSGLLCFAVSPPLAEKFHMSKGASPARFVDPELEAGGRAVGADLVGTSFAGSLSEFTSASSPGIFDAPVDVDASKTLDTQDDYQEIEFALSSYVDTSLSVPIFFDDDDDINLNNQDAGSRVPQLCVAPVLRTCDLLPGGAPWSDIDRHGTLERTGVAPRDSSDLPLPNPSINQAYCDARRRDAQQPCSFWDHGLNCSAGASRPVELWVSYFMYVVVPDKLPSDNCARTWQWAFEESKIEGGSRANQPSAYKADEDGDSKEVWYPQPEQMGTPTDPGIFKLPNGMGGGAQETARLYGNPAPLSGHSASILPSQKRMPYPVLRSLFSLFAALCDTPGSHKKSWTRVAAVRQLPRYSQPIRRRSTPR
eukprot:COSAG02_NODE_5874_length_3971_cov_5.196798_3_plen_590_part_00